MGFHVIKSPFPIPAVTLNPRLKLQFLCYELPNGFKGLAIIPKAGLSAGGGVSAGISGVVSAGLQINVNLNYNFKVIGKREGTNG